MTFKLYQQIGEVGPALSIVIVMMSFFRYSVRDVKSKLVGLFHFLSLATYGSVATLDLRGMEVNIPQNIYAIANFIILIVVYYHALNKRYRNFYLVVGIGFLTFGLFNILFWQRMNFNTYTMTVGSFIVVINCILYWYRLMIDLPVQQLQRVPMFWFNSAFLIYNAGALFLFLFTEYLVKVLHNNLLIYWTFHNILIFVQQLVIIIGLWQDLRNIKSRSSLPSAL